jgi:hypothetical protein
LSRLGELEACHGFILVPELELPLKQLRAMAIELLMDKGDTRDLGVHWTN